MKPGLQGNTDDMLTLLIILLVVVLLAGYLVYRHLDANIRGISVAGIGPRPAKVTERNVTYQPLNILLLG